MAIGPVLAIAGIPIGGSASLSLRGASFRKAKMFADHLESSWVEFNLSALEQEKPLVDSLLDRVDEMMHRPSRYPAARAASALLTDVRALDASLLSRLQPKARCAQSPPDRTVAAFRSL